jgi:hypothetical protein
MEEDFDQDELMFPIKLSTTLIELLKSLPRSVSPWRNDVNALVRLKFADMVKHGQFTSLRRTDAGTNYLKSINQY